MKTTQWSLLESPINIKINARIITQFADELKRPAEIVADILWEGISLTNVLINPENSYIIHPFYKTLLKCEKTREK